MTTDLFSSAADSPIAPAERCFAVAPSDSEELPFATKAIYIGTAGDLTLRSVAGSEDVTFRNLADGSVLDVRVLAVRATGTTAADIVTLA
jgi:hypothetical protein